MKSLRLAMKRPLYLSLPSTSPLSCSRCSSSCTRSPGSGAAAAATATPGAASLGVEALIWDRVLTKSIGVPSLPSMLTGSRPSSPLDSCVHQALAPTHGVEEELSGAEASVEGGGNKALALWGLVPSRKQERIEAMVTSFDGDSRQLELSWLLEHRYLEAVGGSLASNALLAHTGHHLGNVDGGALAATLAHVQGAVVPMQRPDSSLRRPLLKSLMYSCTLAYPVLTVCCFFSTRRGAGVTSSMPMEKPLLPMKRALSLAKRFMQLAATKAE
ncbi:MAG: hypothetical protein FRX49_10220 [Trebouxia sp. A1-2]|nr:MAG: hypothetical protein FRX49_10220 [Trebouxia sp. A1-2]